MGDKPVSLVILDISVLLALGSRHILTRDFYIVKAKPATHYLDIWGMVNRSAKPVFILAFTADLHVENFGLERGLYLEILKRVSAICWPYYAFPFDRDKDPARYGSTFLDRINTTPQRVYQTWKEIVEIVPINIDLPHCLSAGEMRKKPSSKRWEFVVPGATYITRKIALESGRKQKLKIPDYWKMYRWMVSVPYKVYSRITTKLYSTRLHQNIASNFFRYLISRSEVSFACGSELKYFVRKFLEIPAELTALVALPSNDFSDYGFMDGVHYLASEPEEAGAKAKFLIQNRGFKEKLVRNAWNLVGENHSAAARASQVISCLDSFQQGKLKRASFHKGRFEVIS